MAIHIVSVFFLLLVLVRNADGTLRLDVTPIEVSPGQTESLVVNCSFTFVQMSNITGLISLFLSKMNQQQTFQDLISINAFSPDQINVLSQVNGSMMGHIDGDGESFLTIQWTYPGVDKAGMYRCEASGMDNSGYPSKVIQTAVVTLEQPDINQLTEKVSDLQRQLESQEKTIDILLSQVNTMQTQLNYLNLDKFATNSDSYLSAIYKNHTYVLSTTGWNNATEAEQKCKDYYNGYLAQVDDSNEETFVNNFLLNLSLTDVNFVLISGTHSHHVWTYIGSSSPMPYINWYPQEYDPPDYPCLAKFKYYQFKVQNFPCTARDEPAKHFLCEINLQ